MSLETLTITYLFQTNPCGVEALAVDNLADATGTFQTNPCGVEAAVSCNNEAAISSFQTNPCGVEAHWPIFTNSSSTVSDEPLWG